MSAAIRDTPAAAFAMPEGIRCVLIDTKSGLRARPDDWDAPLECFKEGTEPQAIAPMFQPEMRDVIAPNFLSPASAPIEGAPTPADLPGAAELHPLSAPGVVGEELDDEVSPPPPPHPMFQ
jgi:hypothetical protein